MNKRILVVGLLVLAILSLAIAGLAHERNDGSYFTIVDENGVAVYMTGWNVKTGDQCIAENNIRYQVVSIEGDIARARTIGQVNLSLYLENNDQGFFAKWLEPRIAQAQQSAKVAILHTHTDESYVPTDGIESKLGNGGIIKVGAVFAEALRSQGIKAIHSQTKHDPHDDMAYERSRRTVINLVKQQPTAVFDIHRDAVPPQVYAGKVSGQDVSKIQLVVGKYGPTGKQIEEYALQIKATADKKHQGLVKGIFFAKGGDYNQDLHPRSMLLEVGAHTNDRESAERGIALFADVIPSILGKTAPAQVAKNGAAGVGTAAAGPSGATKSMGWILGLVLVGGAAFLFLSTGSLKEAGAKLKQFTTSEFTNFLAPRKKRSRKTDKKIHPKKTSKNNVIIIYQGGRSYLPLAVCHLHFHKDVAIPPPPSVDWWHRDQLPLSVIGIDRYGNMVCALVTGRYGAVYQRAIEGIADIFDIEVTVIDIDKLVFNSLPIMSLLYLKLALSRAFPRYCGSAFINDLHVFLGRTSLVSEVYKGRDSS